MSKEQIKKEWPTHRLEGLRMDIEGLRMFLLGASLGLPIDGQPEIFEDQMRDFRTMLGHFELLLED